MSITRNFIIGHHCYSATGPEATVDHFIPSSVKDIKHGLCGDQCDDKPGYHPYERERHGMTLRRCLLKDLTKTTFHSVTPNGKKCL